MRRYLPGGRAARVVRDRYLFPGVERTRPFPEYRRLDSLRQRGLPVPAAVAARYQRGHFGYAAELITERLPAARSLAGMLTAGDMDVSRSAAVGRCLRRFHGAGVRHAGPSAHNIMLGAQGEVWLSDFEQGRPRKPGSWRERVLDRLERSLAKDGAGRDGWQDGFRQFRIAHGA